MLKYFGTCYLARTEVPPTAEPVLRIMAQSPVNILVTAPNGYRVGYHYQTETMVNEIAGATYSGPGTEPQVVNIPSPLPGAYIVDVIGIGTGTYTIQMESVAEDGSLTDTTAWTDTTTPGQLDTTDIQLSESGTFEDTQPPLVGVPEIPFDLIMLMRAQTKAD
jgi:hypothetical protein